MTMRCCAGLLIALAALMSACDQPRELVLASTTSTVDSGLLDVLLPAFEQTQDDVRVKTVGVGSGEALALGRHGDADVLLVHSPADERAFMEAGHGLRRLPVMMNDYIIAGPPGDPADVGTAATAIDALRLIASSGEPFVTRGDSSGTHRRELSLWSDAATAPPARIDVGQGMGEALTIASERGAYILSDRSTYLALSGNLRLDILVEDPDRLANHYSVITVRDSRNADVADAFADWLTSSAAAALIRSFGVERFGQPLFFPAAGGTTN
jgi:tungstate transport system substrate-binding protein